MMAGMTWGTFGAPPQEEKKPKAKKISAAKKGKSTKRSEKTIPRKRYA